MAIKRITTCDLCGQQAHNCATFKIPMGRGGKSWWQNFFRVGDWLTDEVDICQDCIEEIRRARLNHIERENVTVEVE